MRLWKALDLEGRACHGGRYQYDLPKNGKPGKWTPRITDIEPCKRGYHACRDQDLVKWCAGQRIWLAELRGVRVADDKVVCEQMRLVSPTPWGETVARLFAVECAADVQHLMTDERSLTAMEVAYRYALGDATDDERAAAWAAARAAARAAAWAAAWAAASDAASDAARAAAWDAASDAARAAAWDAASDAASDAARQRQTARLLWWIGAENTYPESL